MKRLPLLLLIASAAFAQPALINQTLLYPVIGPSAIASLPTAGIKTGALAVATDAMTAGSCTVNGGSAIALCRWSGTAWESLGGAGGGSGTPGGLTTAVQYNSAGSFAGDSGFTYDVGTQTATIDKLNVNTTANLPGGPGGGMYISGYFDMLAIAAPGTPSAGRGRPYVDSTSKNLAVKDDAGVVKHGVQTQAAVSNSFVTAISDAGAVTVAQPTPANLAAGAYNAAMTMGISGSIAPGLGTVSANQINGVGLNTLATGPLANTISTGIPRAATATDMSIPVACLDSGATDAYACTLAPAITAYTTGAHYRFKANTANTGAATIAFNGISPAVAIVKVAGGVSTVLATNDIRAGQWVDLIYDGTYMQIQSTLGNAPATTADSVTGAANLITATRLVAVLSSGAVTELAGITATGGVITATGFVGDLTGAVTGNADTATALAANPADCDPGDFATGIAANGTLICDAPPAVGAGATANLTDFTPTVATATVTVAAGRARIGSYTPVEIVEGTAEFTSGTGDVKVFIDSTNNLVCQMETGIAATAGGSMACSNSATPAYPANSIPIADLTVTSGPMGVALDSDDRAFFSNRGISAATGISIADSGGVASIGVDAASVFLLGGTNAPTGSLDLTGASGFTVNAETAGASITTVQKMWVPAVNCTGTTASLNWDTIATLAPAVACSAGTTNTGMIRGLAAFSNSEISQMQTAIMLPSDWTGAVDLRFKWQTSATSGSVVWQAASICVADAEVNDVAWNTASVVIDAAKGTTLQTNDATITGLTMTGCAAGELLHLKVFRDFAHASDDLAATADLIGVEITTRRAQ